MFFKKKNQEKGTEDTTGIGAAVNHISKLSSKKIFPWFVLSGKYKFTSGSNDLLEANEVECYDKTSPEDVDRLFEEIKNKAEDLETYKIRKKYGDVLELCEDQFLGDTQHSRLFAILTCIETKASLANHLTGMRQVMEGVFEHMKEKGLVPDVLSTNQTSLFLSGKHRLFPHKTNFVHPMFAENVYRLIPVLQDGSHDNEDLSLRVQEYIRASSSNYFLQSAAFLFLDVIVGSIDLLKSYPNRETNLSLWQSNTTNSIFQNEGKIIKMAANGYITLEDTQTGEEISFPEHIAKTVFQDLKIGTVIYYNIKGESNGKKLIENIEIKD